MVQKWKETDRKSAMSRLLPTNATETIAKSTLDSILTTKTSSIDCSVKIGKFSPQPLIWPDVQATADNKWWLTGLAFILILKANQQFSHIWIKNPLQGDMCIKVFGTNLVSNSIYEEISRAPREYLYTIWGGGT